jgi:hypothetical protein
MILGCANTFVCLFVLFCLNLNMTVMRQVGFWHFKVTNWFDGSWSETVSQQLYPSLHKYESHSTVYYVMVCPANDPTFGSLRVHSSNSLKRAIFGFYLLYLNLDTSMAKVFFFFGAFERSPTCVYIPIHVAWQRWGCIMGSHTLWYGFQIIEAHNKRCRVKP